MKRIIHFSPHYTCLLIIFLVMLTGYSALGQTPGLILKPATGAGAAVMDPDQDGYVSQKAGGIQQGFRTNDVAESEIPFVAIVRPDPLGDILRGPTGGFTEIVGTDAAGNNAILTYSDGINLYFRFRLSNYAPNSKSYSLLVDTDQKFGFTGPNADPNAIAGNPGFEVEIVLRTNFSVDVYNVNGTVSGTLVATHSYDTNCQKSIALSAAGGSPDYFYDFYVPYPALFSSSTALRYVASTGMSPSPAMGSNSASDVGGATSSGVSLDQLYADLINVQTPTVPGQEVLDRTNCPTITGPVSSGATNVSGTAEDNGATIRLYVNDVQVGSTTVSGGGWTITGLTPLVGGASLKATAQAIGKGESSASCNLTFVGSSCSLMPVVVSIDNGDKGGRVTNVSSYPVGTVFTLYNAATNAEWVDTRDNNPYTITATDRTRGTIDIGCGGTGNCLNDGSYYIMALAPGECESQKAYFCVGSAISASSVPVIDNTILPLSSYVTGTNGVAGAVLYVYANGTQIGSKTLPTGGAWSVPVPSASLCNTTLTARQIASSQCISAISAAVTIGSAVTSAPTISINKCNSSITTVTGYSGESNGTTIQLYVNGVQRAGTATVSGGTWTFNTTIINAGQTITARATNSSACKTISDLSAPVILSGTTTLTGSYSIPSTVVEGASSVSVVVSGVSGTYTLNLYIDGDKIGSQSFTGSGTVNVPVTYTSDIYTGGHLQVSLTQGIQCESTLSPVLKTVECNTPGFTNSVISTPLSNKCVTTSGSITVTNSQTGVIYTPVDGAGIVRGYSVLGTGATITLTTHAFPTSGEAIFYIKAQRIVPSGICEATSAVSVSFNAFAPPQFTTHPANKIVCNGESTTLTASWTGIGPFDVQWQVNNGAGFINLAEGGIYSQATATGVAATSATLNISNVSGLDNYTFRCIVTDTSVPIDCQSNTSNPSTLSVPIVTISNALVANATLGNNGSVDITVSGGNAPYMYDWHHLNGSGTFGELEDVTGLSEGTYTVTVKDANGCVYQQTFIVGGVSSINLGFVSQTNVTCYGSNNGSFTVNASSGTAPYSYSIDNFATSQASGVFSGLQPGSYTVKARDAGLKASNTVLVTITEPLEMVVSAVISNPSVILNDGTIHATITGGTNNFSCSLFKVGTPTAIQSYSHAGREMNFSDLTAGTYYINVTDANGCIASNSNIILTAPVVQTVQCSHTASHSFNGSTNTISGYDGDYNYFASDWIESPLRNEIEIYENALAFGRIPADNNTYAWTTASSIYRQIDLQGASSIVLSYKVQAYGASNQDNFTVQLYVNDVLRATYTMNGGNQYNTQLPVTLNNIPFNTISGNSLNKIEFRISTGQSRSNLRIDDFTLTFTKSLSVGVVTLPATCNNGKIDLSIIGGYPPYLVDWDNDGTIDFNDSEDLTELAPGTYKVTVKDSRNCTSTQLTAIVDNAPLTASITGSNDPTCVGGGSNGTITAALSATGGGGPFTYQLYKGASELVSSVYSLTTTKTFTGLTPGTYYVKVIQSADNCSTQTAPVTLTMPVLTSNITSVGATTICSGSSTTIKVDITGGTSPYTVLLSNGQNISNYTSGSAITVSPLISTTYTVVSITDASFCVSSSNTGSAVITVNPALPVSVSIAANPSGAICSGTSVTYTATPLNAGANPTYTWKVGATTVGANSATYTTSSLLNGDVVTCIVTKDPAETCMTGSPATSNSLVMSVTTPPSAIAGTNIITCSTYGAVNITTGSSAGNYSSISWSSSGTGTFTNANSLTLASYTPSSNDITAGTVTLTLTVYANAPCSNAFSTKTLTITSGQTAGFSYPGSPYCSNEANPLPVFNEGATGGTFSSTSGLVFVSTATGQINLSASTPGNYTITNTIAAFGGCGVATATSDITIFPDGSWTGAEDQDWNNPANWACNQLPTIVTNVFIANGLLNYPVLSTGDAGKAYHITIDDEASATVMGNTLQIAGDISNAGIFDATEGTIELKGTVPQTIEENVFDTNTLLNLIINNAAGVTLQGALNITGVVSPAMGTFNANGYLTLISTAGQTALIDGAGAGDVTGHVNMQRYLPLSFGYKYFSSPFQSATVAELAQEVNLTETFATIYKYDENHSRDSLGTTVYYTGWTKYITASNLLVPMVGYAANLGTGTDPLTVTMSGVVNNGALNTTLFNRNRKYTKGFNLVGNPYPSPIDWNAVGWTKTNIDNAIYFFNAGNTDRYTGVYSSYVDGISSDGGIASNIIAAMQGFFVHVTDGAYPVQATLGVSNAVRINTLAPKFKSAVIDNRPLLRLTAGFELKKAIEDAAVVYFDPAAGLHFEKEKDALKLENTDELVPNIYTLAGGLKLSINGLSVPSDSVSYIPVGITTYRDGWINFRAENANDLPFMQVYLADVETGRFHDLRQSPVVRFYLQPGVCDSRFKLVFSKAPFTGQYPGLGRLFTLVRSGNRILVKVNLPDNSKGTLLVTNLLGQTILRREVAEKQTVEINPNITTGVYVISLVSGKRTESEKILMRQDYE